MAAKTTPGDTPTPEVPTLAGQRAIAPATNDNAPELIQPAAQPDIQADLQQDDAAPVLRDRRRPLPNP